ncbi:ECF transporter S component [Carnobacteriaceae bacterium zg-C25]|nr:ECF transporter S component [Carnobacteriaceae bacterium zg-C25]
MKQQTTKNLVFTALFAALVFLATTFFKIEVAPRTMVHMGNAMVVVSFLVLGTKYGMIASVIGLGVFDIANGYLSSIHFVILETILVVGVIGLVFNKMKRNDSFFNVVTLGVIAGLVKIIAIFIRRYITFLLTVGNDTVLALTLARMYNTFITAIVTVIAVPILYFAIKPMIERIKKY